mmetsp:Transcript_14069/g.33356  ORF Transcript_14069/g.33356 Transcript_14069/m.33356 type:complete len:219 (-) Transcript_14069:428-1084(-)
MTPLALNSSIIYTFIHGTPLLVFSFFKDRCSRVDHAAHARRLRRREQRLLLGLGGPWLLPRRALRLEAHVLGPGAAQMLPRLRHQAAGQDDKPTEGGRAARVAVAAARVALGGHRLRAPPHLQRTTRGDGPRSLALGIGGVRRARAAEELPRRVLLGDAPAWGRPRLRLRPAQHVHPGPDLGAAQPNRPRPELGLPPGRQKFGPGPRVRGGPRCARVL